MFPEAFINNTGTVLGDEAALLLDTIRNVPAPVSIRWNPYKVDSPRREVNGIAVSGNIPWNRYGNYLADRPSFTTDPLFHGGLYYVQEAASMFVEHILRSVAGEGVRLLDMCAAPGGKSTLYSTLVGPEGIVVANEVIRNRVSVLADNVRKWGIGNVVVTNNDPSTLSNLGEWFDVIAVDAPCSGEGMFRKTPESISEWSVDNVRMCAQRQRRILADAWKALAPGGVLIYSTCTFNREENEKNIEWLSAEYDLEDAEITAPADWGIVETEAGGIKCFRFYPHLTQGEGFFCAAVRKADAKAQAGRPTLKRSLFTDISRKDTVELARWTGQPEHMAFAAIGDNLYGYYRTAFHDIRTVSETLNAVHSGICMGQLFGGRLKPDHSLAMFHDLNRNAVPVSALSIDDALTYLRKGELPDCSILAEGLNLAQFNGAAIGWIKRIGRRANNLYPKSLAILNK